MFVQKQYRLDLEQGNYLTSSDDQSELMWVVDEATEVGNVNHVKFDKRGAEPEIVTREVFIEDGDPEFPYYRERPPTLSELVEFAARALDRYHRFNSPLAHEAYQFVVNEIQDSLLRIGELAHKLS